LRRAHDGAQLAVIMTAYLTCLSLEISTYVLCCAGVMPPLKNYFIHYLISIRIQVFDNLLCIESRSQTAMLWNKDERVDTF
jgi:hypothetical protein